MSTLDRLRVMSDGFHLRPLCTHSDDFGPCPCFSIDQPDFRAEGHCWRIPHYYGSGRYCSCEAERTDGGGCCVHVWGDPDAGREIKRVLDATDWYGPWHLVMEGPA